MIFFMCLEIAMRQKRFGDSWYLKVAVSLIPIFWVGLHITYNFMRVWTS
ncbi:hypothetical protein Goarm_007893 [Gossypium armourianum]|uniref:Uncharacterized protein n=1 Tax=Gossypium armourianum TaxID=34283 RepID=A0A7J9JN58_9ROSI|nr:hypothetical protein [Gossypium armourianum]